MSKNINLCTKCGSAAEVTTTIRNREGEPDIYIITCKNSLCRFWKMSGNNSELYDYDDYDDKKTL